MKTNFTIFLVVLAIFSRSSALDLSKDVEGKDCMVLEPLRNHTFNLTDLRSGLGFTVRSSDQPETFYFNVCGPLGRKCNDQTVGACVQLGEKQTVFGYEEKLFWNDGTLRFSYVGEKCDDKHNYTMNVMLHCDYSGRKSDFIGAFHESGQCEATVILRTELACLPTPDNLVNKNCIVKSPSGDVFDLNPLKDTNHRVEGPNKSTFIIGICNPVLYGHEAACEAGSSICHYDPQAKNGSMQYKNVGVMTEDFVYKADVDGNDSISLTMKGNEICKGDKKFTSKIVFTCDRLATASYATYHKQSDECLHLFTWPTTLACPDKTPCKITNSDTGVSYDFSSLAGIKYEAVNLNNTEEKIIFSVCAPAYEAWMDKAGSYVDNIKISQSRSAGNANDKLRLENKNPYLLYEDGASCLRFGNRYTTRIDFICADSENDEVPVAVEDGCSITIQFKTLLACGNIKNCIAKTYNDEEIDLSPLIDFDGNYVATVNQTTLPKEVSPVKYLLNVCRPLNSKYSLNCRGAAGACRTVVEKDGKHEQELSLGHPDYSLSTAKVGDNNEVIMKYFDGAACLTDPSEKSSTRIRFHCDEKAGLGNPILQSIEDCQYSFDFPTNIMCNEQIAELLTNSCSLVNEKLSVSVDLKLFDSLNYKIGDKTMMVCSGPEQKFYTLVYKESMVRIEFAQEMGKDKDKTDVKIQLKCSANTKTYHNYQDRVLVMHESPLICRLFNITPKKFPIPTPAHDDDNPKNETSSGGFALGYVFLVSVVIFAFVALYLVIRNPERREILRNIVKFRSGSSNVQYSRNMNDDEYILN